jgi:hypothetical protein
MVQWIVANLGEGVTLRREEEGKLDSHAFALVPRAWRNPPQSLIFFQAQHPVDIEVCRINGCAYNSTTLYAANANSPCYQSNASETLHRHTGALPTFQ